MEGARQGNKGNEVSIHKKIKQDIYKRISFLFSQDNVPFFVCDYNFLHNEVIQSGNNALGAGSLPIVGKAPLPTLQSK